MALGKASRCQAPTCPLRASVCPLAPWLAADLWNGNGLAAWAASIPGWAPVNWARGLMGWRFSSNLKLEISCTWLIHAWSFLSAVCTVSYHTFISPMVLLRRLQFVFLTTSPKKTSQGQCALGPRPGMGVSLLSVYLYHLSFCLAFACSRKGWVCLELSCRCLWCGGWKSTQLLLCFNCISE